MATATKDYYGTLGVKKSASAEDIRKLGRLAGVSEAQPSGSPQAKS